MTKPTDSCHVLIVGAGIHALTVCCYLLDADPGLAGRIRVVDPAGWISAWRRNFRRLGLDRLRSSCVHHPDPDPYALLRFAARRHRSHELTGPIQRPSAALFQDFCTHLIDSHDLDRAVIRDYAIDLIPAGSGFAATLASGHRLRAQHVVLATCAMRPRRPAVAPAGLRHSSAIDLSRERLAGHHLVIIGGGLTGAQLALAAEAGGARVDLMTRRPRLVRETDFEPTWLGTMLPSFFESDPSRRAALIQQTRRRGSVPATTAQALTARGPDRTLQLRECWTVEHIRRSHAGWDVLTNHGALAAASDVWLATGYSVATVNEPLLRRVQAWCPAPIVAGLPVLSDDLSWPGTRVHLTGGLAALAIGPAAQNVVGARMVAERLCGAIAGRPSSRTPQYPHP